MPYKGIDVSKWQENIDWLKVKESGINFALIRAAYGEYTDTKFKQHIAGAISSGIDVGVYVYSIAKTKEKAAAEAKHVLELIKPYKITMPIVFDIESEEANSLSNAERTNLCIAFCQKIEQAGYYAMIYANRNWLENKLNYEKIKCYDIWLAEWRKKALWKGKHGIWQYGTEKINGIGICDTNISYKNYPEIIKNANLNNLSKEQVHKKPNKIDNKIKIGQKIHYKGPVQYSSWGVGSKPIHVDGTYTIQKIIPNRKYGVLIDKIGWIAEKDIKQ